MKPFAFIILLACAACATAQSLRIYNIPRGASHPNTDTIYTSRLNFRPGQFTSPSADASYQLYCIRRGASSSWYIRMHAHDKTHAKRDFVANNLTLKIDTVTYTDTALVDPPNSLILTTTGNIFTFDQVQWFSITESALSRFADAKVADIRWYGPNELYDHPLSQDDIDALAEAYEGMKSEK